MRHVHVRFLALASLLVFSLCFISTVHGSSTSHVTWELTGISGHASGIILTLDDVTYVYADFPVTVEWTIDTEHTVTITTPIYDDVAGERYMFLPSDACTTSTTSVAYYLGRSELRPVADSSYTPCESTFTYTAPWFDEEVILNWQVQYQLTLNLNGHGSSSPTSPVWYDSGNFVSVTIFNEPSWVMSGITGTGIGSYTGIGNPFTVTMSAPITEDVSWTNMPSGWVGLYTSTSSPTVSAISQNVLKLPTLGSNLVCILFLIGIGLLVAILLVAHRSGKKRRSRKHR